MIETPLVFVCEMLAFQQEVERLDEGPAPVVPEIAVDDLFQPGFVGDEHLRQCRNKGIQPLFAFLFRNRAKDPDDAVLLQRLGKFIGVCFLRYVNAELNSTPDVWIVKEPDGRVFPG